MVSRWSSMSGLSVHPCYGLWSDCADAWESSRGAFGMAKEAKFLQPDQTAGLCRLIWVFFGLSCQKVSHIVALGVNMVVMTYVISFRCLGERNYMVPCYGFYSRAYKIHTINQKGVSGCVPVYCISPLSMPGNRSTCSLSEYYWTINCPVPVDKLTVCKQRLLRRLLCLL